MFVGGQGGFAPGRIDDRLILVTAIADRRPAGARGRRAAWMASPCSRQVMWETTAAWSQAAACDADQHHRQGQPAGAARRREAVADEVIDQSVRPRLEGVK